MSLATGVGYAKGSADRARSGTGRVGYVDCYVIMSFRPLDRTLIPRSYPDSMDTGAGITRMY